MINIILVFWMCFLPITNTWIGNTVWSIDWESFPMQMISNIIHNECDLWLCFGLLIKSFFVESLEMYREYKSRTSITKAE